jgi:DNA-binding GntR family transcriptional regulator
MVMFMVLKLIPSMRYKSKQDAAYDTLREAIVTGNLAPGERLIIADIAGNLGISEIPVRESLKRLHSEGLIIKNGTAVTVAPISSEEIIELLGVRIELEGMAMRRVAKNIDDQGLRELTNILMEMEGAIQAKDGIAFGRLNKDFHITAYTYCGVSALVRAIEDTWRQTERARYIFRATSLRATRSAPEHWAMLDALRKHNTEEAEKLMIEHLRQSFSLFIEQLTAMQ